MPSPFNIRARRKERKGAESTEPTSSKGVASAPSLTHVSSPSSLSQSSTQPLSDKSISQQPSSDQRSQLNISQIPSSDTSSQEHTSEPDSQNTFEKALQKRLEKILDPADRNIFKDSQQNISPEKLLSKIKDFDNIYNQRSTSRRCADTLTKVFQVMNQFMSGVAIGIQASPEISSLVVGGIRLIIDIAVKFVEFFNKLTGMISHLGDYLESFALYAKAAGNIASVQHALLDAYEDIFTFCKHARIIFVNDDGSARSPQRTSMTTFFKVQWQPFEVQFGEIESNFKHHSSVLLQSTQAVQLESLLDVQSRLKLVMSATTELQNQSKTYYEVPSLQVSQYVGRPELLREIENSFTNATQSMPSPKRVVILGMGGQGKTQLALEYCRVARISEWYQAIFWIDASSSNTVTRGFERIYSKISDQRQMFDSVESKVDFVKETLTTWKKSWLIVFDNYDSPDQFKNISEYFPQGEAGVILFTSRHADSQRLGTTIRLTRMTESEGLELLLRQSNHEANDENNAEGLKIIRKLGYLPLAIDQSGAYISQRNLPLSRFIKHYEDRKEYILKHTPTLWEYRRKLGNDKDETLLSVFTTWELSFQQVGKTEKDRTMIGHFLTLSAFFNASDVGEDLFSVSLDMEDEPCMWSELFTSGGAWDPYKYEDTIVELSNLSLLQRIDVESTASNFSLHPLVADWLKLRTDQKGREDCTIEAISLLAEYIDKQDGDKLPFEAKQYLLAHMDACLYNDQEYLKDLDRREIAGRKMASTFTLYYEFLDRYLEAETLYQRALAGYEKTLGPEHTSTLDTVNNLGVLYWKQGKLVKAEDMYQRALVGYEKSLGPNHTSTLETVNNLGVLYEKQGKRVEAETLHQRALAGREKSLGPKHTSTLDTVNNLGVLYWKQGKLVEAEDMYQQALAGREKKLGPEHTATLDVVYNLGLLYQNQGKLVEAEAMYQRALAGRKKTLGPEHKSRLKAADALENLYQELGKLAEKQKERD